MKTIPEKTKKKRENSPLNIIYPNPTSLFFADVPDFPPIANPELIASITPTNNINK
jgi:hypothetical protein